jgi:hypothetical protein
MINVVPCQIKAPCGIGQIFKHTIMFAVLSEVLAFTVETPEIKDIPDISDKALVALDSFRYRFSSFICRIIFFF